MIKILIASVVAPAAIAASNSLMGSPGIGLVASLALPTLCAGAYGAAAVKNKITSLKNRAADKISYTANLTELAKTGKLPRAYGRNALMLEVSSALSTGSLVLVGPSGVGKTALVEELAHWINEGKIPQLDGAQLLRLDLRALQGNPDISTTVSKIFSGGDSVALRSCLEELKELNMKGVKTILFIDEIQDLIRSNLNIFDSFKEELARGTIRIIGATTNAGVIEDLRGRGGTGEGMKRRLPEVKVTEILPEEAVHILQKKALAEQEFYNKRGWAFTLSPGFCKDLIILNYAYMAPLKESAAKLAESKKSEGFRNPYKDYSELLLPESALRELGKIVLYFYQKDDRPLTLGREEVIKYFVEQKKLEESSLKQQLGIAEAEKSFNLTSLNSCFIKTTPRIQAREIPSVVVSNAKEVASILKSNGQGPFIALAGGARELLVEIASSLNPGFVYYRCDLRVLSEANPNGEMLGRFLKSLQQKAKEEGKSPCLILENFNLQWALGARQGLFNGSSSEGVSFGAIGAGLQNLAGQVASGVGSLQGTLGTTLANGIKETLPSAAASTKATPQEGLPAAITTLFSCMEKEHIFTVLLDSSTLDLRTTVPWIPHSIEPLTLEEQREWLVQYHAVQTENRTFLQGDQEAFPIQPLLFALYDLTESKDPTVVLNLAEQVISNAAKGTLGQLPHYCRSALGNKKSLDEIKSTLDKYAKMDVGQVVKGIASEGGCCSKSLRGALHSMMASELSSCLKIEEESGSRQQGLMEQIAVGIAPQNTLISLDYSMLKGMSPLLKKMVLDLISQGVNPQSVCLFKDEEALKDAEVIRFLENTSLRKVICFFKKKSGDQQASTGIRGVVEGVVQQGLSAVAPTLGNLGLGTAATQQPVTASVKLSFSEMVFVPPALSVEELKSLLKAKLEGFMTLTDEKKEAFKKLYLYMLLKQPPVQTLEGIVNSIRNDIKSFSSTDTIETICERFADWYGNDFNMDKTDFLYVVSPRLTSIGYRMGRVVSSFFSTLGSILFAPLRKLGSAAITIASIVSTGSVLLGPLAWLRRRIIGI